jgi:hypothetical protein
MMKHRGRNKQVRERICEDPGLTRRDSHLVREVIIHLLVDDYTTSKTFRAAPLINFPIRCDLL